jgi:hypothetical protein
MVICGAPWWEERLTLVRDSAANDLQDVLSGVMIADEITFDRRVNAD